MAPRLSPTHYSPAESTAAPEKCPLCSEGTNTICTGIGKEGSSGVVAAGRWRRGRR